MLARGRKSDDRIGRIVATGGERPSKETEAERLMRMEQWLAFWDGYFARLEARDADKGPRSMGQELPKGGK